MTLVTPDAPEVVFRMTVNGCHVTVTKGDQYVVSATNAIGEPSPDAEREIRKALYRFIGGKIS